MEAGKTVLFVESVAGIAGDMFAAACVDSGAVSAEALQDIPELLGFPDVLVDISKTKRAQVAATHIDVRGPDEAWVQFLERRPSVGQLLPRSGEAGTPARDPDAHHLHLPLDVIEAVFSESKLAAETVEIARSLYREMARAEAKAHGIDPSLVHFHEIGHIDSIVDAAMAAVCLSTIAPDRVYASPVKLGRGNIRIAHGVYPVPPPASAFLCEGFPVDPVPEGIRRKDVELSTPTGLAILRILRPEFIEGWPEGLVDSVGYGAGSMDLGTVPNVTRVVLLKLRGGEEPLNLPYEREEIAEIICNLDDQSPERSAWILQKAMERGALDAWITPIVGKKNRPAHTFSILVGLEQEGDFIDWILRTSSTFGVRRRRWTKYQLARRLEARQTPHGTVHYKLGMNTDGEVIKEKPEFEDLARIWEQFPEFEP